MRLRKKRKRLSSSSVGAFLTSALQCGSFRQRGEANTGRQANDNEQELDEEVQQITANNNNNNSAALGTLGTTTAPTTSSSSSSSSSSSTSTTATATTSSISLPHSNTNTTTTATTTTTTTNQRAANYKEIYFDEIYENEINTADNLFQFNFIYSCAYCRANLAIHSDLISRSFQGSHGRAYLFDKVVNINQRPAEDRLLLTGLHAVADIYCECCNHTLGWKYEKAFEKSQKYKEGRYIVEQAHMIKTNNWSSPEQ